MLRIAICDDEKIFLDILNEFLNDYLCKLSIDSEILIFRNPKLLIHSYNQCPFDLLILDIDMPELSGFDLAESIRNKSNQTYIIFISSKHNLVYNSFKYTPFYFIRKTCTDEMLSELRFAMSKLLDSFKQNKKIEIIDTTIGSDVIPIKNIIYIKSEKHYLLYYIKSLYGPPLRERANLYTREFELINFDFIKTHQRYLVNMAHINRFDCYINSILMSNNDNVPISKKLKSNVIQQYQIYKRK